MSTEISTEICAEMVADNMNLANERANEQGTILDALQASLADLENKHHVLRLDSSKKLETLESMV